MIKARWIQFWTWWNAQMIRFTRWQLDRLQRQVRRMIEGKGR